MDKHTCCHCIGIIRTGDVGEPLGFSSQPYMSTAFVMVLGNAI